MWKRIFALTALFTWMQAAVAGAGLTEMERRWIQAGEPVLMHARLQQLPLDIIVQPGAQPGVAPLALAYINNRCKLVLSMRGNPAAEDTLAHVPAELTTVVIEAMVAHEVGHCWRYARGVWQTVPAGFMDAQAASVITSPLYERWQTMRQIRREEGFADLVALAWTQRHHPQHYAQVFAWLSQLRHDPEVPGSHHDTHAWIRLVSAPSAFDARGNVFHQALALWESGLQVDEH